MPGGNISMHPLLQGMPGAAPPHCSGSQTKCLAIHNHLSNSKTKRVDAEEPCLVKLQQCTPYYRACLVQHHHTVLERRPWALLSTTTAPTENTKLWMLETMPGGNQAIKPLLQGMTRAALPHCSGAQTKGLAIHKNRFN